MDPDKNLEEQRELAARLVDDPSDLDSTARLAELVLALDEWLARGGFAPKRWKRRM